MFDRNSLEKILFIKSFFDFYLKQQFLQLFKTLFKRTISLLITKSIIDFNFEQNLKVIISYNYFFFLLKTFPELYGTPCDVSPIFTIDKKNYININYLSKK
jgi:hypothetical protein